MNREAPVTVLAQHARRALAASGGGTLSIEGFAALAGPDPQVEVLLYDDDGEPRFLCEPDSPVAVAAARQHQAALEVTCCRRAGCRREVRFAGRLRLVDADDAGGRVVHIVGLSLGRVSMRQDGGGDVELPLTCYRAVGAARAAGADVGPSSDPSAESTLAYAERVARHTNLAHGEAVRCAAATIAGTSPELVLAAEIADLDDQGFTVHWIGVEGAQSSPVSFPRVAHSPGDLAVLLRSALTGS